MNKRIREAVMAKTAQYHAALRYALRCKVAAALRQKYAEPLDPGNIPHSKALSNALIGAGVGSAGGAGIGALIQALRGKDILSGMGIGAGAGALGGGALGYGLTRDPVYDYTIAEEAKEHPVVPHLPSVPRDPALDNVAADTLNTRQYGGSVLQDPVNVSVPVGDTGYSIDVPPGANAEQTPLLWLPE